MASAEEITDLEEPDFSDPEYRAIFLERLELMSDVLDFKRGCRVARNNAGIYLTYICDCGLLPPNIQALRGPALLCIEDCDQCGLYPLFGYGKEDDAPAPSNVVPLRRPPSET